MRKKEDRYADEKVQAGTDCDAAKAGGGWDRQRYDHAFTPSGKGGITFPLAQGVLPD